MYEAINPLCHLGERFISCQILEPRLSDVFPRPTESDEKEILFCDGQFSFLTVLDPDTPFLSLQDLVDSCGVLKRMSCMCL